MVRPRLAVSVLCVVVQSGFSSLRGSSLEAPGQEILKHACVESRLFSPVNDSFSRGKTISVSRHSRSSLRDSKILVR